MANQMEKLQDLSQSELQELLDNAERVESMALESDEVQTLHCTPGRLHQFTSAFHLTGLSECETGFKGSLVLLM